MFKSHHQKTVEGKADSDTFKRKMKPEFPKSKIN